MGFTKKDESGTFVRVSNGKLSYTTDKDDILGVPVTYEDSETGEKKVTYKVYQPGFYGKIVKLQYTDSKFGGGQILNVHIKDAEDFKIILQLNSDSSLHHSFVNMIMNENFDFDKFVDLSTWKQDKKSNGKIFTNNYIGLKQDGEKVAFTHTKETSDGPQPNKKTVAGKAKWDWSPVEDYYYEVVKNKLIPILEDITDEVIEEPKEEIKGSHKPAKPNMSKESSSNFAPKEKENNNLIDEESDDLPF